MKTKILATAAILLVVPGVALASPFEDSFLEEDSSDELFDDSFFTDDSQEDTGDRDTEGCNGVGIGEAETEASTEDSMLTVDGKYCANTGGYSVTGENVDVQGDTVDVEFQLQSPDDGDVVTQAVTGVDYSVQETLEEGEYDLTYSVLLDGDTVDSGDRQIEIGDSEDSFFDDDFFREIDSEDSESSDSGSDGSESGDSSDEEESAVSEEAFIQEAPEEGEPGFEAGTDDWVSYDNPRDEYKRNYESNDGEGSGKMCVTLLNEEGEHIIGDSVPDTQVEIPTGDSLDWHPHADPVNVEFPIDQNYDAPLDADQFGTTDDLPQGDGYMDSHCIEWHDLDEEATIEYGEAEVTGTHSDDIRVVGYIQRAHESWDTDVDPIEDAETYEEAGGGWTMYPGGSHGQMVAVLQLDR